MKRSPYLYLIPLAVIFVALGVVLFFLHPFAPLLLVASLGIQLPLVWVFIRNSHNNAYRARSDKSREQFQKDANAGAWLEMEESEAASLNYKYVNASGRALNLLNRAELLESLGRKSEAEALLAQMKPEKLPKPEEPRFHDLAQRLHEKTPALEE